MDYDYLGPYTIQEFWKSIFYRGCVIICTHFYTQTCQKNKIKESLMLFSSNALVNI